MSSRPHLLEGVPGGHVTDHAHVCPLVSPTPAHSYLEMRLTPSKHKLTPENRISQACNSAVQLEPRFDALQAKETQNSEFVPATSQQMSFQCSSGNGVRHEISQHCWGDAVGHRHQVSQGSFSSVVPSVAESNLIGNSLVPPHSEMAHVSGLAHTRTAPTQRGGSPAPGNVVHPGISQEASTVGTLHAQHETVALMPSSTSSLTGHQDLPTSLHQQALSSVTVTETGYCERCVSMQNSLKGRHESCNSEQSASLHQLTSSNPGSQGAQTGGYEERTWSKHGPAGDHKVSCSEGGNAETGNELPCQSHSSSKHGSLDPPSSKQTHKSGTDCYKPEVERFKTPRTLPETTQGLPRSSKRELVHMSTQTLNCESKAIQTDEEMATVQRSEPTASAGQGSTGGMDVDDNVPTLMVSSGLRASVELSGSAGAVEKGAAEHRWSSTEDFRWTPAVAENCMPQPLLASTISARPTISVKTGASGRSTTRGAASCGMVGRRGGVAGMRGVEEEGLALSAILNTQDLNSGPREGPCGSIESESCSVSRWVLNLKYLACL